MAVRKVLPALQLETKPNFLQGSFVFPNATYWAHGRIEGSPDVICEFTFGVSPVHDRIYVDSLTVQLEYQRKGYATAFLKALVARVEDGYGVSMSITPLCEIHSAKPFWNALRAGYEPGLNVTMDIRLGEEMDAEKLRWRSQCEVLNTEEFQAKVIGSQ